ncbi:MAG: hypothetical protein HYR96_13140 [Deltaproteobacteria bacterium]|nr:hypothetical protein [Deltaproteobacteria bacterium]MBI3295681.1 hypothetical protein [Deltaproteobacteria bacterium]
MRETAFVLAALFAACAEATPRQIQKFNFDFDDNVFSTKAQIYLSHKTTHQETPVSTAKWAEVRQLFGKPGQWFEFELLPTGLRDFNDKGPRGTDLFESQVQSALDDALWNWKAKSWGALIDAMHNPEKLEHTAFITARMHSPEGMMKGFELLRRRRLIENVPRIDTLYIVGWDGFEPQMKKLLEGQAKTVAQRTDEPVKKTEEIPADSAGRKAIVMKYLLDALQETPLPVGAKPITDREGTAKEPLQLWGFSDDDFGNYMTAYCVLSQEVAEKKWPHVKIILFYSGKLGPMEVPRDEACAKRYGPIPKKKTGARRTKSKAGGPLPTEVSEEEYSQLSLVIRPDGRPRQLLPEEGTYMGASVPR